MEATPKKLLDQVLDAIRLACRYAAVQALCLQNREGLLTSAPSLLLVALQPLRTRAALRFALPRCAQDFVDTA